MSLSRRPSAVDAVLARGCVGISLPAAALADRSAVESALPALAHVQACGVPLFVHPGGFATREACLDDPLWWTALTDYVSQMQAAWLTFEAFGRRDPETFYDTSSYGPMIVEAMARWVGHAQLVYGSDRPVIEPVATGREVELMRNATQLLTPARTFA